MDSPRPEPPKRRVMEPSACSKRENSRALVSASKPMPVSRTWMTSRALASPRTADTASRTWPCVVNFTALPSRLQTICRSRAASPR